MEPPSRHVFVTIKNRLTIKECILYQQVEIHRDSNPYESDGDSSKIETKQQGGGKKPSV